MLCKKNYLININFEESHWLSLTGNYLGLSTTEKKYLYSMTQPFSNAVLLYRASRDGFTVKAFHDRCDGRENTVTIIRNNLNFVFGGFTAARWSSTSGYIADPNAFIFSLRRNGTLSNYKLPIYSSFVNYAIYGHSSHGPTFGRFDYGYDISIIDQSNLDTGSYSWILSYMPPTYPSGSDRWSFLAGGNRTWLTTEIEVYQIFK